MDGSFLVVVLLKPLGLSFVSTLYGCGFWYCDVNHWFKFEILRQWLRNWLMPFTKTGKQALTLYIAHIFVGMGVLEAFGLLGGQSAEFSIFASSLFIISAVIYVVIWARVFRAGPIEWLMRRIAG